jgi:hypothetical protein
MVNIRAPGCIDLKERFGQRCRIRYEDTSDRSRARDPWLAMIDCRHGHIYPHGGDQLGDSTNTRGPIAKRLAALPCVRSQSIAPLCLAVWRIANRVRRP